MPTRAGVARQAAPAQPHHYLTMVGVGSEHRGRGYGRCLIDQVTTLATADPRSTGVALDTENEANVPRYQRWGFELTETNELHGIRVHRMRLAPSRS